MSARRPTLPCSNFGTGCSNSSTTTRTRAWAAKDSFRLRPCSEVSGSQRARNGYSNLRRIPAATGSAAFLVRLTRERSSVGKLRKVYNPDHKRGPGVLTQSQNVEVDKLIDERRMSCLQIRVIVLCAFIIFLDGYDIQTLAVTVNWLSTEWHLTLGDFTLPQTAALIGYAISAALVAGLGDRWGRRPILIIAAALMGIASVGTAFSANVNQIAFWRLLTGMGFGASVPNATAITSEFVPARRRAALITVMYANIALGAVVAGFAAPTIYAWMGWKAVFLAGGFGPIIVG